MAKLFKTSSAAFFTFITLTGCAGLFQSTSLDSDALETISESVMEVVIPKPSKDSLKYEKPLPMELLPYSLRTDKYFSFGTAFAVNPKEFVTAAHVLKLGSQSSSDNIYIRDKNGHVHPVDKIVKFSANHDFAVFTVRGIKINNFLRVNMKPQINRKVYTVGNALGQGIVIRDGLYTSDTPEQSMGAWNWIRFSAAASPGNSGGPLLDESGSIIGVVSKKSPNENLNFAVPIAQVIKGQESYALFNQRDQLYRLENMDLTSRSSIEKKIDLPKTYSELQMSFKAMMKEYLIILREKLLSENRNEIFPEGEKSTRLIYTLKGASFPVVIAKGADGNWLPAVPKNIKRADLGDNGVLAHSTFGKTGIILLRKPDGLPLEDLIKDPRRLLDLILKVGYLYRQIGPEKIKITSLGKAQKEERFLDRYGRVWFINTWPIEYDDTKLVTFTLPLPGGCVILARKKQTDAIDLAEMPELKILTDFIYMSYQGTFLEWQSFMKMKDVLPAFLSKIEMDFTHLDYFRYASAKLSFSCNPSVIRISDRSFLSLNPVFIRDGGKTFLDIGNITVNADRFDQTAFGIHRIARPPKGLPEEYQNMWTKLLDGKFPYNRSAYYKDKLTIIETAFGAPATTDKGPHDNSFIYAVTFTKPGSAAQKEIETSLDALLKNVAILEGKKSR